MKKAAVVLASVLFSILLFEVGCFLLALTNLLDMPVPNYTLRTRVGSSLGANQNFWADSNPHFGVWHTPNSTLDHEKACFSVTYRSNSHGMRDPERTMASQDRRVVFLGDSMVEGFGVERKERMTTLLESNTGIEFLNFGTAGDFGPTQYYLLYKHFAKQFAHDVVLIGMFPANDFRDDDIKVAPRSYGDRYRPYWVGTSPDYELTYHRATLEKKTSQASSVSSIDDETHSSPGLKSILRSFSYAYNALSFAARLMVMREPQSYSPFYDYTEEQLAKAEHSFALIKKEAGDRPVVLVLLPAEQDLKRNNGAAESPLSTALREFGAHNDILILDLLSLMSAQDERWSDYFLECDAHWNVYGHKTAFGLIQKFLVEKNLLSPSPSEND